MRLDVDRTALLADSGICPRGGGRDAALQQRE
jgi:hypothetical protein